MKFYWKASVLALIPYTGGVFVNEIDSTGGVVLFLLVVFVVFNTLLSIWYQLTKIGEYGGRNNAKI